MKLLSNRGALAVMAAAGFALAQSAGQARADVIISSFDTAITGWTATWGTAPVLAFDAEDSKGSATSGSLSVAAGYYTAADDGWEQSVITFNFPAPITGSDFESVSVDVKVDPSSVASLGGNYGYFELKRPDGSALGGVNLTGTDWKTISFPIAPTEGTLSGIIIQDGNSGYQGPVTYKLDNFVFHAPPPPQTVVDRFDTAETTHWSATWGSSPVVTWDPLDANGSPDSGSLRVDAEYFTPEDNGWEQMVITHNFDAPVVGSDHVSVSVDVKVDPTSVPTADGNYGYFELKRGDGSALGGVNLTSTEWTTITFPIAATEGTLSSIIIQNGNSGFKGPIIYYLDNFVFTQKTGGAKPPALAIAKNDHPGLKLYASAPGQAYQRQNVVYAPSESFENSLWWVNQGAPMSYSVTWADFPDAATYAGFQGHIILSRDSGKGKTPDWDDPNVILIEFQYAGIGKARARFLHKVNEAAGNAMLYRTADNAASGPVGVLGEIQSESMIGTWTITFKNDTDVTLTAPDGKTVDLAIPAEDAGYYEPTTRGLSTQFGVQPNADGRVGLSAVISEIKITKGADVVVDETFATQELDPTVWTVRAADPAGVFAFPADTELLVSWPLPDAGFSAQAATSLKGPWAATGDPTLIGARRVLKVNKSELPATGGAYFRLTDTP